MHTTIWASRRKELLVIACLATAWPSAARAYRPFNGTDAAVAARGEMEIELGPLGYLREGSAGFLVAPSVIFNWGFADRWELVLEGRQFVHLGSDVPEPRWSVEETALSLKIVLREGALQEKSGASIATEVGALLPTINGEPGAGAQATVIVSRRWQDLTVHLNGAAAWTRAHTLGLFGGAIFEVHDAWTVRPVAEIFVEGEHNAATTVSGLVGAICRVRDNLSFDTGVRLARTDGVDAFEIRAGLTWGFSMGFPR